MADEPDEKPAESPDEPKATESAAKGSVDEPGMVETGGAPTSSEPKKKKKKKKKKKRTAEAADEKPVGPALSPEGWERPGFVLEFPKDEELDRLVRAFELGNYAFVRENAKKLADGAADESVRRAAGELLRRVDPDPLVKILFFMSVALFAFMVFYAYRTHGH